MKRKRLPLWEIEFEKLRAVECLKEFDILSQEIKRELIAETKRQERKQRNLAKALRIRDRLYRVRDFNVSDRCTIVEDEWGDVRDKHREIRRLYAKRDRLYWVLNIMYTYWAFDHKIIDFKANKRTLTLNYLGKRYDEILARVIEESKQRRSDWKKARVRKRRENARKNKEARDSHRLRSTISQLLTVRLGVGETEVLIHTTGPLVQEETLAQEYGDNVLRALRMSRMQTDGLDQ